MKSLLLFLLIDWSCLYAQLILAPSSVMVSSPPASIFTGSSLNLTCFIELVEDLVSGVELQVLWTGPTNTLIADTIPTGTGTSYTSTLPLTSLTATDAGTYTCTASLISSLPFVQHSNSTMASTSLTLQLLAPSTVVLSSNSPVFIGSSLILTCSIEWVEDLASGVELKVVWTGPNNTVTGDTTHTIIGTSYTRSLLLTSLTASDAGTYTCTARFTSSLPFLTASPTTSNSITIITVGPPSTSIITKVSSQATSINVTWRQHTGDVVDSYIISYLYIIRGCEETVRGGNTISGIDGSIRSYSLSDVEEDSDFDISITAMNGAGSSPAPAWITATTLVAAPSGIVASLMTTTITSTTITIAWGRVSCRRRNVEITRYAILYGPSSYSSGWSGTFIMAINTTNVYIIIGLIPRTNYTIQVRADYSSINSILRGTILATVDAETAVPAVLGFLLKATPYPNNSVVALTAIGEGNNALICLTNLTTCCRGSDTGGMGARGGWMLPDGSLVPSSSSVSTVSITRSRGPSAVLLHRRGSAMGPTGVFTCEVPDASGEGRSIYIYIYAGQVPGTLSITDIFYDHEALVLTCTSSGRPIESVTWLKNGSVIRGGSSGFSQSQRITERVTATYQQLLSSAYAFEFMGRFTCVVRDGSGGTARRTLVLNGLDTLHVAITSSGSSIAGTTYSLTCDVTIVPHLRHKPVTGWVRPNGTRIENGTLENMSVFSSSPSTTLTLIFDPLSTSHGGIYWCIASVMDSDASLSISANTSYNLTVQIPALDVVVFLRGYPIDSHFFTGLHLNLTCIIHISPTDLDVTTSVAVLTEWRKSGTSLTTNSRVSVDEGTVEVGPLQYQTSLLFKSLDKTRDEGNYTCAIHVIHRLTDFPDAVTDAAIYRFITVETLFFQLKLTGVSNCENWRSMDPVSKDMDIVEAIVKFMDASCDCDFTADHLTDRVFLCLPSSPRSVTYQAQLHGTLQTPVEDLINKLQEWVFSGIIIPVQLLPLTLEDVCVSSSSSTMECEATESTQMEDESPTGVRSVSVIAAVTVVMVVVFVLAIIALVITIVTVKIKISKQKSMEESRRLSAIPLSYVNTMMDSTPVYEDIKYYEPQDPSKSTTAEIGIKIAICPAYIPTIQSANDLDDYEQV